jgi:ribonuclease R
MRKKAGKPTGKPHRDKQGSPKAPNSRLNKHREDIPDAQQVIEYIVKYADRKPKISDLLYAFNIRKNQAQEAFKDMIFMLIKTGKIIKSNTGVLKVKNKKEATQTFVGRVDFVNARYCYVICEEFEKDVWVSAQHALNAFDGDTVEVSVFESSLNNANKGPEGEITKIVARKRDEFVGKIEVSPRFSFVRPDNRKIHVDIFIPAEKIGEAKNGDKVVVKIIEWPGRDKSPVAKVLRSLGAAGTNNAEIHSILEEFELPYEFAESVLKDAEAISTTIDQSEIKKRRDFRGVTTFTIDPVDAKDFDDALSIQKIDENTWEIGVHIADVTHYVRPNSIIEKEASSRATSVYLVDRVVPMLPEKLSNDLCSLRPNEDKLTFSAVFQLNENGKIMHEWFGRTIIHSDRRFAYEEVQEILENKAGEYVEEILTLNKIAYALRKDRFKKGSISFESVEVKFRLDEHGVPLEVVPKIRKDAHKLIEDFMLLANKRVAEFVYNQRKGNDKNTMVYRTHDYPNPEKLKSLVVFAKRFGYDMRMEDEDKISGALNQLSEEVEGKPEQNVLQSLAIRCMAKAIYTTDADMHFGLSFKHYTHFTSPIRRYPDMMVHRLLQHYLDGGKPYDKKILDDQCQHSSDMEKRAAEAERSSIKYKQVEYMSILAKDHEVYEGIISGVTDFGVFVEMVATKCEGLVRMQEFDDDFYSFDPDNYRIVGRGKKKFYTLGDKIMVKVKKTDLERRTIDLELAK